MADKVLGTSQEMTAAATSFQNHVLEFDTATKTLQGAVTHLQETWCGGGYDSFVLAMGNWDKDMNIIKTDLTNLSDGVKKSDAVFTSVDDDIARAFAPFAGF